ncbi:ribonuclease Z [Paenibacillus thermotolerans]|uniref:ribonuclease Z n=1 Tax=Paenibacillus thermotolerans TaxID=3027807 RepID=UPI00236764EC|nr:MULTISPECIES: ribonuclease Z [unclassified Paenibacillus]
MELYFLGTGAGMPSRKRNVTSIALNLLPERGTMWLFDCGEGTQHQMLNSPLKPGRLEFVFITHLHGDHIYGLPGMLSSRSYQGGETPLTVFGPPGIRRYLETTLDVSDSHFEYELRIREIEDEGVVFEDDQFTVSAVRLEHRVESFGYRIAERDIPGALDSARLTKAGVPPGPVYARLKRGETVTLPDGRVIRGADYVSAPVKGRTLAVFGDTRPCASSLELARGCDVVVHEATFKHDRLDKAAAFYHTTAVQAAELALKAGAGSLILTHLSSRYQDEQAHELLDEARNIFPNAHVAEDFWSFPIHRRK